MPVEIARLYEFVNSLDQRRYVEHGRPHTEHDELSTAERLEDWMRVRGLLEKGARIRAGDHSRVLRLRSALRSFLQQAPERRASQAGAAAELNQSATGFPLVLNVSSKGPGLEPAPGASGLGRILAELQLLAETGRLDRLKMCASDECRWVFYDRSKPSNRRWCSSALCGNRHKTRTYRDRRKLDASR